MKRALIEGTRIAQIVDPGQDFEVAAPLYWVDVVDGTTERDTYENGAVVPADTYRASSTLEEAIDRKKQALASTFARARDAGTVITVGATPISVATSHDAQQELRELAHRLSGGSTQKGVTRSGTPLLFTEAITQQCLAAVNDHHAVCNEAEYDHLLAILALTTIAEVDAYDVSTGWPTGA